MATFDEIDGPQSPGDPDNIKVSSKGVTRDDGGGPEASRMPLAAIGYGDAADPEAHTDVTPTSPLPVGPGLALVVAGTGTAVDDLVIPQTEVLGYRWVTIQTRGTWSGPDSGALLFEVSNVGGADPNDWHTITLAPVGVSLQGIDGELGPQDGIDASPNTMFAGALSARYFRARLVDIDSGTCEATAVLFPFATMPAQVVMAGRGYGSGSGEPLIRDICFPINVDANGRLDTVLSQGPDPFVVTHGLAALDTVSDTLAVTAAEIPFASCERRTWVVIDVSDTWVGELVAEARDAAPWHALPVLDLETGRVVDVITANGLYGVELPVASGRLRARDFTSGSATVTVTHYSGDRAPHHREVAAAAVNGAVAVAGAGRPVLVAAFKGTASIGDNVLVAAPSSGHVRVLGYRIQAHGTTVLTFTDTTATEIPEAPAYSLEAREGCVASASPGAFEFETPDGEGLNVNSTAAVGVSVVAQYVIVP